MLKLKFKSDWTQARLKSPYGLFQWSKQLWVQQLVCSNKIISPFDLFRTYFKYLVSQFKAFLPECGSFFYQHDKLQQWIYIGDVFIPRNVFHCFVGFFFLKTVLFTGLFAGKQCPCMVRKHHCSNRLCTGMNIWVDIFIFSPSLLNKLIIS